MTNERAQRIVDAASDETDDGPADDVAAHSIAPPPVDLADQESQLEDLPASEEPTDEAGAAVDAVVSELTAEPDIDENDTPDAETPDEVESAEDLVTVDEDEAEPDDESEASAAVVTEDASDEDDAVDEEDEDAADEAAPTEALPQLLEALLFVADEPIAPSALGRALDLTPRQVRRGLDDLADTLREENRGVRLQQGPDGAQLVTAPEAASAVELFLGLEANRRLSNAALETLAIIAYRQPVTRHVIEQIRGVSSDGAVATLRARGLIEGIGRAPGPGRPLLFSTTQRFLEHFGLERPDELPPLPDDVELPPEEGGAQLTLDAADGAGAVPVTEEHEDEALVDEVTELEVEETAEAGDDDEVIESALDDDEEFAPFDDVDEIDEIEDDPDLEISDDLGDLSRAAGVALSTPSDSTDGAGSGD